MTTAMLSGIAHRGPVIERGALGWMIVEYQPGWVTPTPRSGFYPTRRKARAALRAHRTHTTREQTGGGR